MDSRTVWVRAITPMHEVRDEAKFGALTFAMRDTGWQGRPLLVVVDGDGYQALTGSHRLAAAQAAGVEQIPVMVIEDADLTSDQWDYDNPAAPHLDDEDRLILLRELGLTDAAALMEQEIAANASAE